MEKIVKDKKFEKDLKNAEKLNKFLKILKIIIIIFLVILMIHVIRNAVLIVTLSNKATKFYNSNNYHTKFYTDLKDSIEVIEKYYKDGVSLTKSYYIFKYENRKMPSYLEYYNSNTHEFDLFWDIPKQDEFKKIEVKRYGEDADNSACFTIIGNPRIDPYLFSISCTTTIEEKFVYYLNFLKNCITLNIKTTQLNGINCYTIKKENSIVYIDKSTGLTIREESFGNSSSITDCYYGFDFITDEDVKKPELEGYTLQED